MFLTTTAMLSAACGAGPARIIDLTGPTMGTTWRVSIVPAEGGTGAVDRSGIDGAIRDTLTRIEALMSTWDPDSELSRFNRSSSTDPFPVAEETFEVFRRAVTLTEESVGAFDAAIAPVVEAWGFGPAGDPARSAPDERELERLLDEAGMRHIELDETARTVRKRRPGVQCDFSALAPGYAADRVAGLLAARGLRNILVDVGGEIVARGHNADGEPWQVAVERPEAPRRTAARVVPLRDAAIATSGDYRNYREVDGRRVSHILDPRTGRPIAHRLASATVVDAEAARADGLATALMVLGPDDGLALARQLDLAVLLLVRNDAGGFDERTTARFDALRN